MDIDSLITFDESQNIHSLLSKVQCIPSSHFTISSFPISHFPFLINSHFLIPTFRVTTSRLLQEKIERVLHIELVLIMVVASGLAGPVLAVSVFTVISGTVHVQIINKIAQEVAWMEGGMGCSPQ